LLRPVVHLAISALCALGVAACGGEGGTSEPFAEGSYGYTLTTEEKAEFTSLLSRDEAEQVEAAGEVTTTMGFDGRSFVQLWVLDGEPWIIGGHSQGSNGTFTVDGDELTLSEPEFGSELRYSWSLQDDALSLTLLDNSAGPDDDPGVLLATEHEFTRLNA
jgi:hypothetical protein